MNNTTNPSILQVFFSLIYPSDNAYIALCAIPPPGVGEPVEHRFTSIAGVHRFLPYLRFRNANGWNVYITPSVLRPGVHHRRKDAFIPYQSIVYLDCDSPESLQQIKERYPLPSVVVRTSPGHYQVYWRLREEVTVEEQEQLMKLMATDTGADKAAVDVSRVLRLPGFWNRKPNRRPCTCDIVFHRPVKTSYKSLISSLSSSLSPSSGSERGIPPPSGAVRRVLATTAGGGAAGRRLSESERDWYLVNRWLALGVEPAEVIRRIAERRRGEKRNVEYYARYTVQKAMQLRASKGGGR